MSKFFGWLKKDKPKSEPQNPPKSTPEEAQEAQSQIDDNSDERLLEQANEQAKLQKIDDHAATEVESPSHGQPAVEVEHTLEERADTEHDQNIIQVETPASVIDASEDAITSNVEPVSVAASTEPSEVFEATTEMSEADLQPVVEHELESQPELVPESKAKPEEEPEKPVKMGLFAKLRQSLSRTKENLGSGFISLFRGKAIDDDLFEELETQLLVADVGIDTTSKIISRLTDSAKRNQLKDGEALYQLLKQQMSNILQEVSQPLEPKSEDGPFVILMVGVNGVGKTTTIGKMAKQFQSQGKKVMLAAGDTFRAAAVEQLQVWGERNNIPVIAQKTGSDSASVIYDALESAKARNVDVLIADTAGRLQNKDHLMEELKKVVRVMRKINPNAPHEVMLTLDAATGQNAVSQTKLFNQAVGLTGITLTKLDGTAKGGVIFALADQFKIPIRYIGVGEGIDDLRPFASDEFVEALFAENGVENSAESTT
ncbi:signal recognition particle-docking protein FtsY [Paraglaciecola sp. T6c]|uniref:signal recognition particle-docking protein FtsY n=1 Tax=Pseudoalteromonas atlantica (strain T6c / ATCC BAA-1087) TaxID=3042615 RepID=UPI00005C6E99|nr:signal recognition particle-docking protein FtsY [Paraglaciecola sp. T6c]ABG42444.1 signal recognition particle-docking protein FtsY [Paraglaciecola sp. T6c]